MTAPVAAFTAVNRFGLGARPGELGEAGADPKSWLMAQLAQPVASPAIFTGLPRSPDVVLELLNLRRRIRSARAEPASQAAPGKPSAPEPGAIGRFGREIYLREEARASRFSSRAVSP